MRIIKGNRWVNRMLKLENISRILKLILVCKNLTRKERETWWVNELYMYLCRCISKQNCKVLIEDCSM